jgi:hypothetical protein
VFLVAPYHGCPPNAAPRSLLYRRELVGTLHRAHTRAPMHAFVVAFTDRKWAQMVAQRLPMGQRPRILTGRKRMSLPSESCGLTKGRQTQQTWAYDQPWEQDWHSGGSDHADAPASSHTQPPPPHSPQLLIPLLTTRLLSCPHRVISHELDEVLAMPCMYDVGLALAHEQLMYSRGKMLLATDLYVPVRDEKTTRLMLHGYMGDGR